MSFAPWQRGHTVFMLRACLRRSGAMRGAYCALRARAGNFPDLLRDLHRDDLVELPAQVFMAKQPPSLPEPGLYRRAASAPRRPANLQHGSHCTKSEPVTTKARDG